MNRVTAVIPTIGRVDTLPTTLTALAFQSHPIDEVILLDESKSSVMRTESVAVALDLLAVQGTRVKILRSRRRGGIGAARVQLIEESSNDLVLMVDDDVVPRPLCLERLVDAIKEKRCLWAVPTCFLVPANITSEGYIDTKVSREDPRVIEWIRRYPWFLPYFRYTESFVEDCTVAGTQTILLKQSALPLFEGMANLGNLPREDTYMTTAMGVGAFTSKTECVHYESSMDRGNWEAAMSTRIYQAVIKHPREWLSLMGDSR